jgi:uncharacterized RDD family membrane protein YckC
MSQQPSGWYDDPSNPEMLRYWDGVTWTNHTAPKKSPTASQSTIGLPQQQAPQPPQATTPVPQGGAWQGQNAPQQYPPQYQQYQQFPQAPAGAWMAGPTTADGVALASWGKRLLAWILDGIIIAVVVQVLTPIFVPEYNALFADMFTAMENGNNTAMERVLADAAGVSVKHAVLTWVVASLYAIPFWMTLAQTPGKMAAGISVRHTDRPGPLDLATALKRRALPLVSAFVGILTLIDGLWPLWDNKRQALHDKVASTQVTVGKQPRKQA